MRGRRWAAVWGTMLCAACGDLPDGDLNEYASARDAGTALDAQAVADAALDAASFDTSGLDASANEADAAVPDAATLDAASPEAAGPTSACVKSAAWTTRERYATRNFGPYVLRNNFWNQGVPGAADQTLWASGPSCWGVDANHSDAEPRGTVKSYPNVMRGWGVGTAGFPNPNHGLAIRVDQLTRARARWKMTAPDNGRTWALWDIYFHENTNPGADRAPVNLTIQQRIVDQDGWMQMDSNGWKRVTVAGYTFREQIEAATGSSTRTRIRLYVDVLKGAVLGVDDMTIDLKALIDHYVNQQLIRGSDYLTSIQAGYEVVSGGTYRTDVFWTALQNEPDGD